MLNVIFTLDYEIHGNGEGCPRALMVEPTRRMMDLFERYGAKLTIMADVAEILKFREYKEQLGRDDYYYEAISDQLRDAIYRGHDVQLHLHCSYFNARHEAGRWVQDWSEYNFAGLPLERLTEVVRIGKQYLEDLLKPIDPQYQCNAFRAANWAVSPSRNVVRALVNNGIRIDTSVFKYGRRAGLVSFDYSNAHSDLVPWPADEEDICRRNHASKLLEIPIYSEHRWIGAFLSANRLYRVLVGRRHKFDNSTLPTQNGSKNSGRITGPVGVLLHRHAWKADFNQCSGHQLIRALERAESKYGRESNALPFVLIGHSKLFMPFNEKNLRPFLSFVAERPQGFNFKRLTDCDSQKDSSPELAAASKRLAV